MRDTKRRFRAKEIKISIPSVSMILNAIILFFIFLLWIYVSIKFGLVEKIYEALNSLFDYSSKCNFQNYENGDNKY